MQTRPWQPVWQGAPRPPEPQVGVMGVAQPQLQFQCASRPPGVMQRSGGAGKVFVVREPLRQVQVVAVQVRLLMAVLPSQRPESVQVPVREFAQ